jgi:DnaD/phage-associated family protein
LDELLDGVIVDTSTTIPIPISFLTELLPAMTDLAEIQVFLATARLVLESGDIGTPVEEPVIVRDRALRHALRVVGSGNEPDNRIATGLELAVGRGVLLRFRTVDRQDERVWYAISTPAARLSIQRMVSGSDAPPRSLWHGNQAPRVEPERPTVFRLYEQNIGLLSPIIAEQLVRAMERYPRDWIEDAIGEAVAYNRRNWRYIQRILQQWAVTGRGENRSESESNHETHRRRS